MKKDEFAFLGYLAVVMAVISFVKGYIFVHPPISPLESAVSAVILSPFMVVMPSIFVGVIASAVFGGKGVEVLTWAAAIFLVYFLDLATHDGGGCNGYEVEDRWGVFSCYER